MLDGGIPITVPFLPYARTVEIGESLVGGAYLCGAEMWAPFISLLATGEGTKLNEDYIKWLTGLGGARLNRCCGWTPIRDLDDKALVAAVRSFCRCPQISGASGSRGSAACR